MGPGTAATPGPSTLTSSRPIMKTVLAVAWPAIVIVVDVPRAVKVLVS
jgi:hypothetical protein